MAERMLIGLASFVAGIIFGIVMSGDVWRDRIEAGAFNFEKKAYVVKPLEGF